MHLILVAVLEAVEATKVAVMAVEALVSVRGGRTDIMTLPVIDVLL